MYQDYKNNLGSEFLEKKYGIIYDSIKIQFVRWGYKLVKEVNKKIPRKVDDNLVIKDYENGLTTKDIMVKYNISHTGVFSRLKRNNVERIEQVYTKRKYRFNQHYFEKIDSEDKAYFLGLIYADGYVTKNSNTFGIGLKYTDSYILQKFISFIEYQGFIRIEKAKIDKRGMNYSEFHSISFSSPILRKDLYDKGVKPEKTYYCDFPKDKIPDSLVHHFIRGFFDGDGCIYNNKGQIVVKFLGTQNMIENISDIVYKEIGIKRRNVRKRKNNIFYDIIYDGNKITKKIYNWLYKDATLFLIRKKDKFIWKI